MAETMEHVKLKTYRSILQQTLDCALGHVQKHDLQKKPVKYSLRQMPNINTSWNELQRDDGIEKTEVNEEKILQLFFKGSREWNTPTYG